MTVSVTGGAPPGVRWTVLPADREPDARAALPHWARLGTDLLVWEERAVVGGGDRDDGGREDGGPLARLGGEVATASGLVLVMQVGRAFQDAHPDVPVLLDHGRHLVVDAARLPAGGDGLCWRADALPADAAVVDVPAPSDRPPDLRAADVVAALSRTAYEADVRWLAGLPTRHSLSASFPIAADGAATRFAALGYAVTRPPIDVGGGTSGNVVAERAGAGGGARDVVLVTAHLDSVNLAGGPAAPAPGADDNASGAAGVLELARVLATRPWSADLRCILFGGEEQGLHGSRQYVAALPPAERARIRAVINLDMVAVRNADPPSVLLEGAPVSAGEIAALADAAAAHTGLAVQTSLHPFASDHVPFIDAGIPAVLTIEGNDSANGAIHSDRDTLDRLDFDLALEVLRMNAAALAGWLRPVAAVPRPAGPVVAWGPGRLDVFAVGPDSGLRRTWWDGAAWRPGAGAFEDLGGTLARE